MRTIKFRGKRIDNGEWVYGFYYEWYSKIKIRSVSFIHIITFDENNLKLLDDQVEVIPETVGQYTGFKDKNGKEIYEQDYIKQVWSGTLELTEIDIINDIRYGFLTNNALYNITEYGDDCVGEIIGNLFDNPELSKNGKS